MWIIALLLSVLPAPAYAHAEASGWDAPRLLATVGLAAAAALYGMALHRSLALKRRHVVAFYGGWLTLFAALLSPLDSAAADSFALHMVQHELLMIAAPPLLILGYPFAALAATLPRGIVRIAAMPLRISPLAAWIIHASALWIWHVPLFFDTAVMSPWVHAAQHACFFFSALLFWWAVFRRVRTGIAVLYVLTTIIHTGALAALLTFAPFSIYRDVALTQQQLGGLIMWVPAGYAMLLAGLIAFSRLMDRYA